MHFRLESSCFQVNKSSFVPVLLFLLLVAGIAEVPRFFQVKVISDTDTTVIHLVSAVSY